MNITDTLNVCVAENMPLFMGSSPSGCAAGLIFSFSCVTLCGRINRTLFPLSVGKLSVYYDTRQKARPQRNLLMRMQYVSVDVGVDALARALLLISITIYSRDIHI